MLSGTTAPRTKASFLFFLPIYHHFPETFFIHCLSYSLNTFAQIKGSTTPEMYFLLLYDNFMCVPFGKKITVSWEFDFVQGARDVYIKENLNTYFSSMKHIVCMRVCVCIWKCLKSTDRILKVILLCLLYKFKNFM